MLHPFKDVEPMKELYLNARKEVVHLIIDNKNSHRVECQHLINRSEAHLIVAKELSIRLIDKPSHSAIIALTYNILYRAENRKSIRQ